ncbi:MAG: EAL domain-containing protein [Halofilum sp. (in: g-proteobacteria)]|nr:EAL domain-containing protein [Halofilum sp. (in: g-proteobacteria)]
MDDGSRVRRETYPEGTVLFHHGEAGERAYYIEDGRVSIVRNGETIAVLGAGDIVGEMALIDDRPRTATAACAAECRLLTIERAYLHEAMARADPSLPYILRMVLKRFRRVMALTDGGNAQVPERPNPRLGGAFADRLKLEEELRSALETDRYFLAVQPVVELDSARAVGVEALLRLDHPEYGVLMPGDFMALAEERGLVVEIGRWVLRAAAEIAREHADRWSFVSVNVAARQLEEGDLLADITDACRQAGIEPDRLMLEVTEMGVVERPEYAAVLLDRVSGLGCRIAIDDFGTGTSSFSQLHRLPFDVLKIDRSLVAALPESERARKIVRAIGRMGAELELQIIAEGIETEHQWTLARDAGCGLAQGYHFARPDLVEGIAGRG